MTLFTKVRTRESYLEEMESPLSSALGVAAEEALLYSPLSSLDRFVELSNEMEGEPVGIGGFDEGYGERRPKSPMVAADEARKRIADEGLDLTVPDAGIPQGALDVLISRKKDERRRQDVLSRSPGGFFPTAAKFGVGVAASLLDPINIGVSFIPVIGPARYAMMLERAGSIAGRAGVRAGVGALEGAVGAAVVEPLVLAAARQEQADYDLSDTLLNIAFGTALGGGLHVGAGAIGDAVSRGHPWQTAKATDPLPKLLEGVEPTTREALLRTSVAQAVTGRAVDVEPIIRADQSAGRVEPSVGRADRGSLPESIRPAEFAVATEPAFPDIISVGPTGIRPSPSTALLHRETDTRGLGDLLIANREGKAERVFAADDTALAIGQGDNVGVNVTFKPGWVSATRHSKPGTGVVGGQEFVIDYIAKGGIDTIEMPVSAYEGLNVGYQRMLRESFDRVDRGDVAVFQAKSVERPAAGVSDMRMPADVDSPEVARLADFEASRQADETVRLTTRPDEDLAEESMADILSEVEAMAGALGDPELPARELAAFDELVTAADDFDRAIHAAAECRLRRG